MKRLIGRECMFEWLGNVLKKRIVKLAIIIFVLAMVAVGVVWAVKTVSVNGNQTVVAATGVLLNSVTVQSNGGSVVSQPITGGEACVMTLPNLTIDGSPSTNTIVITAQNTAGVSETITPTGTASADEYTGATVVSLSANPSPASVSAGSTTTFTYVVTAVGPGNSAVTISIVAS